MGGAVSPDVNAVLMSYEVNGSNDCSGFFSGTSPGFHNCTIWANDAAGVRVDLSPIIIKYNTSATGIGKIEINDELFPSIDASEFSFSPDLNDSLTSGSWTYNQGADDPNVRFWTAKGGNNFLLFWEVAQEDFDLGVCTTAFSLSCLQAATVQTSGTWETPINSNNNKPYGLSHLAFWDTAGSSSSSSSSSNGGGPSSSSGTGIPEPSSLALLGIGALAGAFRLRNRRQRA